VLGVGDHLEVLNHAAWDAKRVANLSKLKDIMKRARTKGASTKS
jgi:hypothetical protein